MEQFDPKAIQEAIRMANTPAGQQLIKLLQQTSGEDLKQAMEQAAEGDYTKAKHAISALAKSPEVQQIMKQLGRNQHG